MPRPRCDLEGSLGTVALFFMVIYSTLTQLSAANKAEPLWLRRVCLALVYSEAIIALICLAGIRFGDPGVLQRSPEACFPLPDRVTDMLRAGRTANGMRNIRASGRTFCVRCMIWRHEGSSHGNPDSDDSSESDSEEEEGEEVHHCSICQRCVRDYDHHCMVLGRCIAGKGYSGTRGYFKVGLSMGVVAFVTLAWCPPPRFVPVWVQNTGSNCCWLLWAVMFGRWAVAEGLKRARGCRLVASWLGRATARGSGWLRVRQQPSGPEQPNLTRI